MTFPINDLTPVSHAGPLPDATDVVVIGGGINGCGIARDAAGRTLLYIISDDNFRLAQRTLLLQMRVEE